MSNIPEARETLIQAIRYWGKRNETARWATVEKALATLEGKVFRNACQRGYDIGQNA